MSVAQGFRLGLNAAGAAPQPLTVMAEPPQASLCSKTDKSVIWRHKLSVLAVIAGDCGDHAV